MRERTQWCRRAWHPKNHTRNNPVRRHAAILSVEQDRRDKSRAEGVTSRRVVSFLFFWPSCDEDCRRGAAGTAQGSRCNRRERRGETRIIYGKEYYCDAVEPLADGGPCRSRSASPYTCIHHFFPPRPSLMSAPTCTGHQQKEHCPDFLLSQRGANAMLSNSPSGTPAENGEHTVWGRARG